MANEIISLEDAFIDLAFSQGELEDLTKEQVKQYIRYICNLRLEQLNIPPLFDIEKNPLPWLDEILNGVEFTNFFDNRVTEYSKSSTKGEWDDVF